MMIKNNLVSRVETMQFVLPEHLNHMERMHGGEIMKLMDNVAGLVFVRHAEGNAVTAGVKELNMIQPIPAKSIIKCVGEVIATGRTSMQVKVCIWLQNVQGREEVLAAEGIFTGVGIDEEGKPREVAKINIGQ